MALWHGSRIKKPMNIGNTALNTHEMLSLAQAQATGKRVVQAADQRSVDAVAKEFSAIMVTQLLNIMFEGIEVDPNFGGGHGEETWRGVLMDEYGKQIGAAGGLGLADMVKAQLLKNQEMGG